MAIRRGLVVAVVVAALEVGAAVLLARGCRPAPVDDADTITRKQHLAAVNDLLADNARVAADRDRLQRAADTALVRAHRAEGEEQAAERRANGLRDRLAASDSARARAQALADSLAAARAGRDSVPLPWDTAGAVVRLDSMARDSSVSCEQRYAWRSEESIALRGSLEACQRARLLYQTRGDSLQARGDSLERDRTAARRLLAASDSALRKEINTPRPCRQRIVFWKVKCSTVDLVVGGTALVGGVLVGRASK